MSAAWAATERLAGPGLPPGGAGNSGVSSGEPRRQRCRAPEENGPGTGNGWRQRVRWSGAMQITDIKLDINNILELVYERECADALPPLLHAPSLQARPANGLPGPVGAGRRAARRGPPPPPRSPAATPRFRGMSAPPRANAAWKDSAASSTRRSARARRGASLPRHVARHPRSLAQVEVGLGQSGQAFAQLPARGRRQAGRHQDVLGMQPQPLVMQPLPGGQEQPEPSARPEMSMPARPVSATAIR